MPRTALLSLLGLSLAGNALLGYFVVRHAAGGAGGAGATPVAVAAPAASRSGPAPAAVAAELTRKLAGPQTPASLREIAAQLRASGLSDAVVKLVMQSLVNEELTRRQRAIFDWAAVPYWKDPRPTPEQLKAMRELQKERQALLAALDLPLSTMEEAIRRRQYGNLSEAKIAALEKIQQDYRELRQEMFESQRGGSGGRDLAAQQKLMQEEQERDIAALLTPEEKLEYELHTSNVSSQLRSQLRGVEVNEAEFRALYAAQKAYSAATAGGNATVEQREAGLGAWDAYQTAARGALGEERYRQFLVTSQLGNANAATFFSERPTITTDQIQGLARLVRAMPVEMQRELSAPGLTNEERQARLTAVTSRLRAQAVQILGEQYAQEAENARILPMLRGPGAVLPAVRLPIPGGG
ncbi:hypothetical protein [Oleiharenicola sp. Vm1]|uniref:hypothetical protein n=1 Tax=Oleiharenicola sp. Vm1 TaxID=3398393 RepID=UPI0039F54CB8